MNDTNDDESIANAINTITEKLSVVLLKEFLKLPTELQMNIVLIKSAQLLLANVLCQVVTNMEELEKVTNEQANEIKELTLNCAFSGFIHKFGIEKH